MGEPSGQATEKWLSIVGIGEDGLAGIGVSARSAIEEAAIVFGGSRHLDLARAAIKGEARPWPNPFDAAMSAVIRERRRKVCVLASGDPFWHGVGATIARYVPAAEFSAYPAPSCFGMAAARLGWPLQDVETVSLHGRAIERLRPFLHHGARILALTSDRDAPTTIARFIAGHGFAHSRFVVLEALGGPAEAISTFIAGTVSDQRFDPLNVVAIEVVADVDAKPVFFGGGLPDDLFEHDGQLTKSDIRAMTLAALQPCRGQLLWDIGAGSGSVAISWMLCHSSMRAVAIEERPDRASCIGLNAARLGTPELTVVEGSAPDALDGLPTPDAVFIGGGGSKPGVAQAAISALRPGGRLVANAVTLEMETTLLSLQGAHGGDLVRLAMVRTAPVGGMTAWRPAMPVTRWSWTKPR